MYIKVLTVMQIMAVNLNNVIVLNVNDGINANNVINVKTCGGVSSIPAMVIL